MRALLLAAALLPTAAAAQETVRVATFNASLNRDAEGALAASLTGEDPQVDKVVAIIRTVDPDVILINEFDYTADNAALMQDRLGGAYPYAFIAPSNTGIATGLDLNGDGEVGTESCALANDAFGYGAFPGQYGMLVLSRHPIDTGAVRTFRTFLWRDMPGARLPENPDGTPFYDTVTTDVLRLSSKSHWDLPITIGDRVLHLLASHPTPPVFDGTEDRNGRRNADEIRFWADYIDGAGYIHDDSGRDGGLADGEVFVIAGDLNADPFDGDSLPGAVRQLLDHPRIDASEVDPLRVPASAGAALAAGRQGGVNNRHVGDPAFDTADFHDEGANAPGNLRVDYVLPSRDGLIRIGGGVFWPATGAPEAGLAEGDTSDHHLVWIDVAFDPPVSN